MTSAGKTRRLLSLAFVIGAFAGSFAMTQPAIAQASQPPAKVIESLNAKLLETMKQAKRLGIKGRFEALEPTLTKTYDTAGMTKTAVGPAWDMLKPDQKTAFVDAFARLMIATYAKRFDDFAGERFEIIETIDQQPTDKMVKTRIVTEGGKAYAVSYVMRQTGAEWKIADVYLDGTISELASRRAEFTSLLKSGGPDALLAAIRKQADRLLDASAG